MNDLIERQAAIACAPVGARPKDIRKRLKELPSVDVPDVIHCQECKYAQVADLNDEQDGYTCQFHRGSIWFSGCYCSWGERKTE